MSKFISKLAANGSAIGLAPKNLIIEQLESSDDLRKELIALLCEKNGFYAFESALHVFHTQSTQSEANLENWNARNLWRYEYDDMTEGMFFFAEDVFGNQFCMSRGAIHLFDAETGLVDRFADTLEDWAERVLNDFELATGYPLAREWQMKNGALPAGKRLMPKIPFVLGGKYNVDNIFALESVSSMRTRGNLAKQIKDLPDGSQIEIRIIP